MKKTALFLIIIFFLSNGTSTFAAQPYEGYTYNSWGVSVPSPNSYEAEFIIDGSTIGTAPLLNPTDMLYRNSRLYILDSGNSRILILDDKYKLIKEISAFRTADGAEVILQNPQSLYVDEQDHLIVADTDSGRVLIADMDGNILRTLGKPESDIFPDSLEFKPEKVLSDKQNNIYVLCTGFYYGAIVYDDKDRFVGFFGSNLVEVSLSQLSDIFWRTFMTKTQKSYVSKYVPVDYTSMDIDDENFIYTCSRSGNSRNEIKKLNPLGSNILQAEVTYDPLNKSDYGELEKLWYNGSYIDTNFIDIDVSDSEIISALDFTYGRVLQYDQDSNLLSAFGGMGSQMGLFKMPAAIENIGSDVLVLDSDKASITVFRLTEYGALVLDATLLYNEGMYQEAMSNWESVLMQNSNSELAYRGIGRAYLQQEKYVEAIRYLKIGQDRAGYSKAFSYYRTQVVRDNFPAIATILVILTLFFIFWDKIRRFIGRFFRKKKKNTTYINPFCVIMHPIDGMDDVRLQTGYRQTVISGIILISWFIASIIERQGTGFIFNLSRPEGLNLWMTAGKTGGIFMLFVLCSWAVGSLNEGEASVYKLINVSASAVLPYAIALLAKTILSNLITYEEGPLLEWALTFVLIYTLFLLFIGNMKAHQYTVGKTVLSLFLTFLAMMISAFVMILIFSLIQQLSIFIMTLYNEIMFRI
ncbi:MAG: hypothetical protein ACYCYM_03790 [Saccharofermentanales bacterium]